MIRRRKKARAIWSYSSPNLLSLNVSSVVNTKQWNTDWLLPPVRVRYLLDTTQAKYLVHQRSLIWMQYRIYNNLSGTPATSPEAVDHYVIKAAVDAEDNAALEYEPFAQPEIPGNLTNWDDEIQGKMPEGIDPFLWRHRVWAPDTNAGAPSSVWGEGGGLAIAQAGIYGDWAQSVQQAWQPNVLVKAKRKLTRGEGLAIGQFWYSSGAFSDTALYIQLRYCCAILCSFHR